VKPDAPAFLAAPGAVLQIPFDGRSQAGKLDADLVMPPGE
jgi:hypothetical protein